MQSQHSGKVPSQGDIASVVDEAAIAWAAGILEGEAWIGKSGNSARITLAMVDRDVVETFALILGLKEPHPNPPPLHRPDRQMQWEVIACGGKAMRILDLLQPYMHARRSAKIDEVRAAMAEKYDPRACVECGKTYYPTPKAPLYQRFCADRCRNRAKKRRVREREQLARAVA